MLLPNKNEELQTPFSKEAWKKEFFCQSHWGQCLELLSHLSRYSDSILLITGPNGIGKSALKRAFIQSEAENFAFCNVRVTKDLTPEQLMSKLDLALDAAKDKDLILLLDDGEHLAKDTMLLLLELSNRDAAKNHLKIVLFATAELEQKMASSDFREEFNKQVHTIELEPLTLAEVEGFIKHQLTAQDKDANLFANKSIIKKLYAASGGNPAKLIELAQELASGNKKAPDGLIKKPISSKIISSALLFGVAMCAFAFLWPHELRTNTQAKDEPIAALENKEQPLPEINQEVQQEAELKLAHMVEAQDAASDEKELVENISTVDENLEKLKILEQKVVQLEEQLHQEQTQRQQDLAKYEKLLKDRTAAKNPAKNFAKPSKYSNDEKYILGVQKHNYALQLFSSDNENAIKTLIKNHKLTKARYYKTKLNNKAWFVLIYGNYTDRNKAIAEIGKLPQEVRKMHPWPREYAHIQQSIRLKP